VTGVTAGCVDWDRRPDQQDGVRWPSPAMRRWILHGTVTTILVAAVLANAVLSCDYVALVLPTGGRLW